MVEAVVEQVVAQIGPDGERLVVVAGPPGAGKSKVLRHVRDKTGAPLVNVMSILSRRLYHLSEAQRINQLPEVLRELINSYSESMLLLDDIDLLFNESLGHDPLSLLEMMSQDKTLVVAWPGIVQDKELTYAIPGHPEYKRYPLGRFSLVMVEPSRDY